MTGLATSKEIPVDYFQFLGNYEELEKVQKWIDPFDATYHHPKGSLPYLRLNIGRELKIVSPSDYIVLYPFGGCNVFEAGDFLAHFKK